MESQAVPQDPQGGDLVYDGIDDYVKFYNKGHLHFLLDINNYETPMVAFRNRNTIDETRT